MYNIEKKVVALGGRNMRKIYDFLNIWMWSFIGVFFGKAISTYMFYKKYLSIYEAQSAPWYIQLLVPMIIVIINTIVVIVARFILKRKLLQNN